MSKEPTLSANKTWPYKRGCPLIREVFKDRLNCTKILIHKKVLFNENTLKKYTIKQKTAKHTKTSLVTDLLYSRQLAQGLNFFNWKVKQVCTR